jgi:DNA (cytosine-5)-methyltransferase 1
VRGGFDVRLGVDWDEDALSVYRANHAHTALQIDLGNVPLAVETIRSVGHVDMISGSPPCQDFSMCSDKRAEGARASLTVSFAHVACAVRPRCVLIENVPQMLVSDAYQDAKRMLVEAGYSVLELRVNSSACGVPQVRRRVFVIAVRHCDPALLKHVREEAEAYSSMPREAECATACARTPTPTFTQHAAGTCLQ